MVPTLTQTCRRLRALFDTAAVYFRDVGRVVHMDRACGWKYLVYIESYGYSSSLKFRLACGSVLFQGECPAHQGHMHDFTGADHQSLDCCA